MRQNIPADLSGAVTGLAHQVDRLRADVDALAVLHDDIASLREDLAAHARALTDLTQMSRTPPTPAGPPGPPDDDHGQRGRAEPEGEPVPEWLTVTDPGLAIAWLNYLSAWVPRVWARYPAADVQPCWPWHPAVVAELLVVRHAWAEATLPDQGPMALAAWQDRWRPAAATRVGRAMTGCDRGAGCHVNRAGHHYIYDRAYLDELAHWWATTDRADPEHAPGLTRERGPHPRTTTTAGRDPGRVNGTRLQETRR